MDTLEVDTGVLQVELARIKEEEDDDGESMSSLTAGAEGSLSHEVHTLSNSDGLVGDDNDTLPSAISHSGEDDDAGVSVDPSAEGSVVSVMDDGSVSNSSAMEAVAAIGNAIPVTSEQVIGLLHVLQTGEAEGVGEGSQGQQVSIAMTLSEGSMLSSGQTIQAITMPDGSTAYLHPPKDGNFLAGQGLTLVDGRTAIVQGLGSDKDASNDSTKLFDGQSIQFEDGTTALLQAGKSVGESFRAVTLDDGTTAFITNANHPDALFGDAASLDGTTLSLDQLTSQGVLNGNSGRLTTEKALAIGEKAYRCGYDGCGRLYTTLHHLKVHERSHTGDRPFKCEFPECNKAFATGYGLKSHTRVHTGEKPYPCMEDNCDKAFKTSGDLQKHVRTHTGERPFRCPFESCDRSFTTSNIRKVHIRTHTGERPYVCQMEGCNRAFASATNYKNHIRIHTGEKPYVCTVAGCGKRFTEYSSLYKHHVVHTHSKPYVCNICSKTYRQTSTLAMHKRTSHGVEVTTDCEVQLFAEQQEGEASSQERPSKRRKVEFTMSNAEGNGSTEEGDGTLVINTTDVQQVNQVATAMMTTGEGEAQGLQMLTLPPATLQQLSQTAGITSISVGDQGQQVLVVADPSQLEALQQLAQQHSFEEAAGLEQAVEAAADSDAVDAITVATGDSAVTDGTMVMFQTE